MEAMGFERAMDAVHAMGVSVEVVVTDRHVTVGSLMKKKYSRTICIYDLVAKIQFV